MLWILLATLSGFLWACVVHIDKHLISKYFKDTGIGGLIIFSALLSLPVVLILSLISKNPYAIQRVDAIALILAGISNLLAVILYLYALEKDETTTVAPLSILTPLVTSVLAFIFLKETLDLQQIIGGITIIFGSLLLTTTFTQKTKFKISYRPLLLMFCSSSLMAINAIVFKGIAIQSDFITTIFWEQIGYLILGILLFTFVSSYRHSFLSVFKDNKLSVLSINASNEVLTLVGNSVFHYATLLVPIALVEIVAEGSQPFYVLLIEILIIVLLKNRAAKAQLIKKSYLARNAIATTVMVIGLILLYI